MRKTFIASAAVAFLLVPTFMFANYVSPGEKIRQKLNANFNEQIIISENGAFATGSTSQTNQTPGASVRQSINSSYNNSITISNSGAVSTTVRTGSSLTPGDKIRAKLQNSFGQVTIVSNQGVVETGTPK